jgi:hypothetical protein
MEQARTAHNPVTVNEPLSVDHINIIRRSICLSTGNSGPRPTIIMIRRPFELPSGRELVCGAWDAWSL